MRCWQTWHWKKATKGSLKPSNYGFDPIRPRNVMANCLTEFSRVWAYNPSLLSNVGLRTWHCFSTIFRNSNHHHARRSIDPQKVLRVFYGPDLQRAHTGPLITRPSSGSWPGQSAPGVSTSKTLSPSRSPPTWGLPQVRDISLHPSTGSQPESSFICSL